MMSKVSLEFAPCKGEHFSSAHTHPCPETKLPQVSKGKPCARHVQVDPGVSKHPTHLLSYKTTGLFGEEDSKKIQQKEKLLSLREKRRTSRNDNIDPLTGKKGMTAITGWIC